MAVIQLPFGGSVISVEIPDFAMEATQQNILDIMRSQTGSMQTMGSELSESNTISQQQVKETRNLKQAITDMKNSDNASRARDAANLALSISGGVTKGIVAASGQEKMSDIFGQTGFLGTLGFTAMGAQIGTVMGILEEFGASLSALRRTGGGLGVDLMDLRQRAADVGIGMETLAKLTVENGAAIRALGTSTANGTDNFLSLNNSLREATREFGFFGLSSREMAALLIDEVELRRQTRNESFLESSSRGALVESMKENLRLNEISASLTGQDIQDRIKARNEFMRNTVIAAANRSLNEDQLNAQKEMVESLSALGPTVTPVIQQAMANMIAGLPFDQANSGFTQLAAAAAENGVDLRSSLESLYGMMMGAADAMDIKTEAQQLVDSFKNAQVSSGFITRAQAGQEGAMMFLQTQQESFATNAKNAAETSKLVNESMVSFDTNIRRGAAAGSAYANMMEKATEKLRTNVIDGFLKAFDIANPNDPGFANFMRNFEKFPDNEAFKSATDFLIEATTFITGAQGLLGMTGAGTQSDFERIVDMGPLGIAIARAIGLNPFGVFGGGTGPVTGGRGNGMSEAARRAADSGQTGILGTAGALALGAGTGAVASSLLAKVDPQEMADALKTAFTFTNTALDVHIRSSSVPFGSSTN